MTEQKPHDIAREALRLLTTRKLAPSPDNYRAMYHEVAGTKPVTPFPQDVLKEIAKALPTKTPGQQKQRSLLEYAIAQLSWDGVKAALVAYGGFAPVAAPSEAVNSSVAPLMEASPSAERSAEITSGFLEQIARLIEYARPALGEDDLRFNEQIKEMVQALRKPEASSDVAMVKLMLGNFCHRLSFAAEDQGEIKNSLLSLLQLIIQNVGELSPDDRWLQGQVSALREAATPPLTLRRLDDVERRLKDVIFKQIEAKGRALQAQEEMRNLLATFIDRLSNMTESTGDYSASIEESARQISQAKSLEEIAPVLKDVISVTKAMASQTANARDELKGMREKVEITDAEISKLHQELDRVSIQARHDPLTGVLNRKGLDEALNREVSQVRRKDTALCMALLDIDNFKKLNDTQGHAAGDSALQHLAQVARESMRPQDTLARYGGEEFVILMPDTPLDRGIEAMVRLQRELTKRFFMAGTEKLLITFSAGVAQLGKEEEGSDAIRRADQAMYLAKRQGKNRVLGS